MLDATPDVLEGAGLQGQAEELEIAGDERDHGQSIHAGVHFHIGRHLHHQPSNTVSDHLPAQDANMRPG